MTNTESSRPIAYLAHLSALAERQFASAERRFDEAAALPMNERAYELLRYRYWQLEIARRFHVGGLAEAVMLCSNYRNLVEVAGGHWESADVHTRARVANKWMIDHQVEITRAITEGRMPQRDVDSIISDLISPA